MQDVHEDLKPTLKKALGYLDEKEDNTKEEIRLMNAIKRYLLTSEEE